MRVFVVFLALVIIYIIHRILHKSASREDQVGLLSSIWRLEKILVIIIIAGVILEKIFKISVFIEGNSSESTSSFWISSIVTAVTVLVSMGIIFIAHHRNDR